MCLRWLAWRSALPASSTSPEGTQRRKVEWLRKDPQATFLTMSPTNAYHWTLIKCTVSREVSEDYPEEGPRVVTAQLDRRP